MKFVIMASGRGSHFIQLHQLSMRHSQVSIVGLLSDKPTAPVVEYAAEHQLPVYVQDGKTHNKETLEAAFLAQLNDWLPDYIILAGYMRILSADFIEQCPCPILNVHPSLLPKYKGLHTHLRAIEAKESQHGATVHVVTPDLDDGPLVAQCVCPIKPDDTPEQLAARLLPMEHHLYAQVVSWLAEERLCWDTQRSVFTFDCKPLPSGGLLI